MDEKKEIVIVSDEDGIIAFDDITVKRDTVNRAEVAEVEKAIESLEQQKADIDSKLVELKAKVLYAEKVIAIADEKRAIETEAAKSTNNTVSEGGASILADVVATDEPDAIVATDVD